MWESQDRRAATRYQTRLRCYVRLPAAPAGAHAPSYPPKLAGYTRNVSATGLGVIVASVEAASACLEDPGNILNVEFELPGGWAEVPSQPGARRNRGRARRGFPRGVSD